MRRKLTKRREVEPDAIHSSPLVTQFITKVMQRGKKSVAERIVYSALDRAAGQLKKEPLEVLNAALENAGPKVELKSRRIGGANYQVPYEVDPARRIALAIRWIIAAAQSGKGKPMEQKLSEELVNAANSTGAAVKKKTDIHRMADANKAFAHFAW